MVQYNEGIASYAPSALLGRKVLRLAHRLNEAVKVLKRSAPLQPHPDILIIETAFWDRHSLHQSAPKTTCLYDFIRFI